MRPEEVIPALKDLAKDLKGTALGADVESKLAALSGSDELKRSLAAAKSFTKVVRGLEKRKGCKACKKRGMKTLQISCPTCRAENKAAISKARKKLDALLEEVGSLPIAKTIRAFSATLD